MYYRYNRGCKWHAVWLHKQKLISDKLVSVPRAMQFFVVPRFTTINGPHVPFLIIYFSVYLICIAIWRLSIHTLYSSNNNSYVDFKISSKSHKNFKISCTVMYFRMIFITSKWKMIISYLSSCEHTEYHIHYKKVFNNKHYIFLVHSTIQRYVIDARNNDAGKLWSNIATKFETQ